MPSSSRLPKVQTLGSSYRTTNTARLSNGNMIEGLEEDGPEASPSDVSALASKVRELEENGVLMKPLVGKIQVDLKVFRNVREGDSPG